MPEASQPLDGVGSVIDSFVATTKANQDHVAEAWARHCELYARYFASLAEAHGPDGIFAANADLVMSSMDSMARNLSAIYQPR